MDFSSIAKVLKFFIMPPKFANKRKKRDDDDDSASTSDSGPEDVKSLS